MSIKSDRSPKKKLDCMEVCKSKYNQMNEELFSNQEAEEQTIDQICLSKSKRVENLFQIILNYEQCLQDNNREDHTNYQVSLLEEHNIISLFLTKCPKTKEPKKTIIKDLALLADDTGNEQVLLLGEVSSEQKAPLPAALKEDL